MVKNKWRIKHIENKVEMKMKLSKEELEFVAEHHELPPKTCVCQDKNDYKIVIDKTRCSLRDQCAPGIGIPANINHIREVCNGTFTKVR